MSFATDKFCDQRVLQPTDDWLSYIAITSLFNAIDREAKELLPYSIFIITRRYKRVEIRQ